MYNARLYRKSASFRIVNFSKNNFCLEKIFAGRTARGNSWFRLFAVETLRDITL